MVCSLALSSPVGGGVEARRQRAPGSPPQGASVHAQGVNGHGASCRSHARGLSIVLQAGKHLENGHAASCWSHARSLAHVPASFHPSRLPGTRQALGAPAGVCLRIYFAAPRDEGMGVRRGRAPRRTPAAAGDPGDGNGDDAACLVESAIAVEAFPCTTRSSFTLGGGQYGVLGRYREPLGRLGLDF